MRSRICRHCEERSEAIQLFICGADYGLLRFARNDGFGRLFEN